MSDLIATIVRDSRARLEQRRRRVPLEELRARARDAAPTRSLDAALGRGFSVIAEHKRRSPTGGPMASENLARSLELYAATPWVSAFSVLTDEDHFSGSLADLERARSLSTGRPILRKDFLYDEYQIWESRVHGADAVLLMTTVHADEPARLAELWALARELGLEALFEIGMEQHAPEELAAIVPADARVWGVNSRRFVAKSGPGSDGRPDASTSLERHRALRGLVPAGRRAVAESGMRDAADLEAARALGYDAALVGTAFLKGPEPIQAVLAEFGRAFGQKAGSR